MLTILSSTPATPSELNAAKIAAFLGVPASFHDAEIPLSRPNLLPGDKAVLVASLAALERVLAPAALAGRSAADCLADFSAVLIYGWEPGAAANKLLAWLTRGAVRGATAGGSSPPRLVVPANSRDFSFQLAGSEFDGRSRESFVFRFDAGSSARTLISRGGDPFFVEIKGGVEGLALWGAPEIADIDAPISREYSALKTSESWVPLMMFLRRHLGPQCWQAGAQRAAFLIDDPLLRPRHGFLDYQKLLESMLRHNYSACIAFIPWNYRRSDRQVAALVRAHSDRYSICVHGCDHTRGEFAGADDRELRGLIHTALWRMEQHQALYSVPFDPVMVFPQGLFSTNAMRALGQSRFLAAINTTPYPVDLPDNALCLREVLEPAVTRFSNIPLFLRRYPRSAAESALDLFVGKPLLLVEHHGYFRHGYAPLEDFVAKIHAAAGELSWCHPADLCERACLRQTLPGGHQRVRFFTDKFVWSQNSEHANAVTLVRRIGPGQPLRAVKINGRTVDHSVTRADLQIPLPVSPGQRIELIVERQSAGPETQSLRHNPIVRGRIFLLRQLSAFRDNYVENSPAVNRVARRALELVRRHK